MIKDFTKLLSLITSDKQITIDLTKEVQPDVAEQVLNQLFDFLFDNQNFKPEETLLMEMNDETLVLNVRRNEDDVFLGFTLPNEKNIINNLKNKNCYVLY